MSKPTAFDTGVGFTGDTLVMIEDQNNAQTRAVSEFVNEPDFGYPSWSIVNGIVIPTGVAQGQFLGVQPYIDITINGDNYLRCGFNQIFYHKDMTAVKACDLRVGMCLAGILPDVIGWANERRVVKAETIKWKFVVTSMDIHYSGISLFSMGVRSLNKNYCTMDFALNSGVITRGLEYEL